MQGFVRLWKRIHKDSEDLAENLIHETLGEDLQGFMRICKTLGRGFVGRGFARLWERICKDS